MRPKETTCWEYDNRLYTTEKEALLEELKKNIIITNIGPFGLTYSLNEKIDYTRVIEICHRLMELK